MTAAKLAAALLLGAGAGLLAGFWLWRTAPAHAPEPAAGQGAEHEASATGEVELADAAVAKLGIVVAPIAAGSALPTVRAPGRLVADPAFAGAARAPLPGRLLAGPEPLPRIGAVVAAGTVFARLVPRLTAVERADFAQRRTQAVAERAAATQAAEVAQRDLERLRALHADGNAASLRAVDLAEVELTTQRGRIAAAEAVLQSLPETGPAGVPLAIPCAGVVAAVLAHADEEVEAGAVLLQVSDPAHLLARIEVPAGAPIDAALATARLELLGPVPVLLPAAAAAWVDGTAGNRVVLLSLGELPPGTRPGLPVIAHLPGSGAAIAGVQLPESAIVRRGDGAWVYVRRSHEGGKATFARVPVQLDTQLGDGWLMRAGDGAPEAGADLVIDGAAALLSAEGQHAGEGG